MAENETCKKKKKRNCLLNLTLTAAWLAQVDEQRTTEREVGVQGPDRTHTQGLKITEENVLPLISASG